jgi:hypothetical protein
MAASNSVKAEQRCFFIQNQSSSKIIKLEAKKNWSLGQLLLMAINPLRKYLTSAKIFTTPLFTTTNQFPISKHNFFR